MVDVGQASIFDREQRTGWREEIQGLLSCRDHYRGVRELVRVRAQLTPVESTAISSVRDQCPTHDTAPVYSDSRRQRNIAIIERISCSAWNLFYGRKSGTFDYWFQEKASTVTDHGS